MCLRRLGEAARGFTLLELLISVVILGILATAAAVNYGKAQQEALDREATSYLRMLRQAARTYYEEWRAYPSVITQTPLVQIPRKGHATSRWGYGYVAAGEGTPPTSAAWSRPQALQKTPDGTYPNPTRSIEISVDGVTTVGTADPSVLTDEP